MTDKPAITVNGEVSPGAMLRAAREAQELTPRETADRLNWMPDYVGIIERDDYEALRSPAFARGYVKAYARLLGLDQESMLSAFDKLRSAQGAPGHKRVETRPLQLQHTGVGVVVGLGVLLLLVLVMWWWRADADAAGRSPAPAPAGPVYPEPSSGEQSMAGGI